MPDRPAPSHKAIRRSALLYMVLLLILSGFSQQVVLAETRPESPGEHVEDDPDVPATQAPEPPPATEPVQQPTQIPEPTQIPTEIPDVPDVVPTEIPAEPPPSTEVPTIPISEPTLPDVDPTIEIVETQEPEPTQHPVNVDDLFAYDVVSGITLGQGESAQFTYTYSVSTSRVGTTLVAGLSGETAGWSIRLYAGDSASDAGIEVSTAELSATRAGDVFAVTVVITAPLESIDPQIISYWITSISTPDDGYPNETGASTTGPSVSFVPPVIATATPTETPTPAASPTAEPSPTPTVTPEPAIPFAPTLTCSPEESLSSTWTTQLCSVTWETTGIVSVNAAVSTGVEGWVVAASSSMDAMALESGASALELVNTVGTESEFLGGQFVIGTKADCHAETAASISVELTATSVIAVPTGDVAVPEAEALPSDVVDPVSSTITEIVTEEIVSQAAIPTPPEISLSSATFMPVDISDARVPSLGTVQIDFNGADPACGWQLTLSYDAFSDGDVSIPIDRLEFVELTGLDQAVTSFDQGVLIVTIPAGSELSSGSLVVTTSLEIPDTLSPGTYSTTITAGAQLTP